MDIFLLLLITLCTNSLRHLIWYIQAQWGQCAGVIVTDPGSMP